MDANDSKTGMQACEPGAADTASATPALTEGRSAVVNAGCGAGAGAGAAAAPRRGVSRRVVALALGCVLAGSAMGAAAVAAGTQLFNGGSALANETTVTEGVRSADTASVAVQQADTSAVLSAADVYEQNVDATVGITTSVTVNYWGYRTQAAVAGSGFVLTSDGYVLTNYHVVEDSDSITVTTTDGTSYDAVLVGGDEETDVAVLKIDAQDLQTVVLGDSDAVRVGDPVYAIGNPLGELTFSLTAGVVSALDRQVTMENGVTMNLLQTDCTINSGNSGGALFNDHGEVVGITNGKYSSGGSSTEASIENIGFAIPINDARSVAEEIIETGSVSKPCIGVTVSDVSEKMQAYGVPAGAAIASVVEGSTAEAAGLQADDVVTACNGEPIEGAKALSDAIGATAVGDVLTLEVSRGGETMEVEVTVGDRAELEAAQQAAADEAEAATGDEYGQWPSDGGSYYGYGMPGMIPGYGYGYGFGMSSSR